MGSGNPPDPIHFFPFLVPSWERLRHFEKHAYSSLGTNMHEFRGASKMCIVCITLHGSFWSDCNGPAEMICTS